MSKKSIKRVIIEYILAISFGSLIGLLIVFLISYNKIKEIEGLNKAIFIKNQNNNTTEHSLSHIFVDKLIQKKEISYKDEILNDLNKFKDYLLQINKTIDEDYKFELEEIKKALNNNSNHSNYTLDLISLNYLTLRKEIIVSIHEDNQKKQNIIKHQNKEDKDD